MVSKAGKDFLRNTIRTVDHHNRVLEEDIMWNSREQKSECKKSRHEKHGRKRCSSNDDREKQREKTSTQDKNIDKKWDHNGFLELYPEMAGKKSKDVNAKKNIKRLNHKGFADLYPDLVNKKLHKRKKKKDKKHKHKSTSSKSREPSSSEKEIWVEKTS